MCENAYHASRARANIDSACVMHYRKSVMCNLCRCNNSIILNLKRGIFGCPWCNRTAGSVQVNSFILVLSLSRWLAQTSNNWISQARMHHDTDVVYFTIPSSVIDWTKHSLETFVHTSESFVQEKSCEISSGIKDGNSEIYEASWATPVSVGFWCQVPSQRMVSPAACWTCSWLSVSSCKNEEQTKRQRWLLTCLCKTSVRAIFSCLVPKSTTFC